LVFVTFLETGSVLNLALALLGFGGALTYLFGLERSSHPPSRWAQLVGWLMMAAASLVPSNILFVPAGLVLLALPAVFVRPRVRTA
jgi:hypothetical protein